MRGPLGGCGAAQPVCVADKRMLAVANRRLRLPDHLMQAVMARGGAAVLAALRANSLAGWGAGSAAQADGREAEAETEGGQGESTAGKVGNRAW